MDSIAATYNGNNLLKLAEDPHLNVGETVSVLILKEPSVTEWVAAASSSPAFDFLNNEAENIYTSEDGKPLDVTR